MTLMQNLISNQCGFSLLANTEDSSVDLVILDPNYQDWDSFCKRGLLAEALRVLKDTGNVLCFTKQPFDYNLRIAINPIFRREIVWTFTNGGAWVSNRMPLVSHQKIFHCAKSQKESYFDQRTGANYSDSTKDFKRTTKVFEGYLEEGKAFKKSEEGIWLRDHLHFNKPQTGKIPSKPQELYDILIKCYCPIGGVVLEPFAGSANFAKSCARQNKFFVGSELDKEVFSYALKNLTGVYP